MSNKAQDQEGAKIFARRDFIPLLILTLAVLMASSCAARHPIKQGVYFSPILNPEDIPHEIRRAEKLARYHPDEEVRAEAHLRLAMLSLNYLNPSPDYLRSLKELKRYISLSPNGKKVGKAKTLIKVLSTYENLLRENDEKREALEKLEGQNKLLDRENRSMRDTIKELKYLDLQLEERRKQVK